VTEEEIFRNIFHYIDVKNFYLIKINLELFFVY
jgi:hypothetical protein